jgi:hypothetical protein
VQRDRQRLLIAFMELRARLRETSAADFAGGEHERADALVQTEHDYVALVETGAQGARLEGNLASADRETTELEVDAAVLVIRQMRELVDAVAARMPARP